MLPIILCDDDNFNLQFSSEHISKVIRSGKLDASIVCMVKSSRDLFHFLTENPGTYLFFLDLDFGKGELNGIDIARRIKKENPACELHRQLNYRASDIYGYAIQFLGASMTPLLLLFKLHSYFYYFRRG